MTKDEKEIAEGILKFTADIMTLRGENTALKDEVTWLRGQLSRQFPSTPVPAEGCRHQFALREDTAGTRWECLYCGAKQ